MKDYIDLLLLIGATLLVGYGVVPTTAYTHMEYGTIVSGYLLVVVALLFALPGIAMDISERLQRFGNIYLAVTGTVYTVAAGSLAFAVTYGICLSNHRSFYGAIGFACVAAAIAVFGAVDNFGSAIRANLALARLRVNR